MNQSTDLVPSSSNNPAGSSSQQRFIQKTIKSGSTKHVEPQSTSWDLASDPNVIMGAGALALTAMNMYRASRSTNTQQQPVVMTRSSGGTVARRTKKSEEGSGGVGTGLAVLGVAAAIGLGAYWYFNSETEERREEDEE